MRGQTIVILGAGAGGLVAAGELRRLLPREHRIVLVERNPQHAFAPSFLWLMNGARRPEQIVRPTRQLVPPGVELVEEEAHAVDTASRQVKTAGQSIPFHHLIIALGAELAPETVPGLAQTAHTFYTFEGATRLRDALAVFRGRRIAVVVAGVPYKCPAAPHEGAMLIADFFRRRGLRDTIELHLFTPEPQPMPVAGPVLGEAVRQMVESRGIAFHPLHKLIEVNPATRELRFEGKDSFACDLLVAIPPHRGPRLLRASGLANEAGWLSVDGTTLATRDENIFAVGDATSIPIPGRWKPEVPLMLPKAGVFAHAQAEVVARRIAAQITGRQPRDTFFGHGYCMLEAGEHMAGFASGNFFAEPSPQIELRNIGRTWHFGKVLFEKWWLAPPGFRRNSLRFTLTLGAKALGIPVITSDTLVPRIRCALHHPPPRFFEAPYRDCL